MIPKIEFTKCTKFFATVHIEGVVYNKSTLINITSSNSKFLKAIILQNRQLDSKTIFSFQILITENNYLNDLEIELVFEDFIYKTKLKDINSSILKKVNERKKLRKLFQKYLENDSFKTMLDIGGRARSNVLRANKYKDIYKKDVTVLDIIEDEGVDIVCDSHEMSKYLPLEHFDIVFSSAVFEHLIMPWKVAIEMNRVMKKGAIAYIGTHQTIGMHDLPWDFLRFSDTSWHGMFNDHTGFEIIETELTELQYIVPFCYEDQFADFEKSAGFMGSAVMVRKISDTKMDWDLTAKDVISNLYPTD